MYLAVCTRPDIADVMKCIESVQHKFYGRALEHCKESAEIFEGNHESLSCVQRDR
jgi:hypothetical protein